ncbi:hypothetical protein SAMN05216499_103202 [Actinacidiphila paucisporea]|uniref:Uncharacterized protein n=1 Tax=Actinacidiphila paucisporea TaxID=310782 RepID=A0A1M6Z2F2_9ACTN|nr:hypothetical protein SAMN05216499_103202 [Actinacidiphila paucisporea]
MPALERMLHTAALRAGGVVRWTGRAVVCRTGAFGFVVCGALVLLAAVGLGDGGGGVGEADGDIEADAEAGGVVAVTVLVVGAPPASDTPAGPHAASVIAAIPVATATTVRTIFMSGTLEPPGSRPRRKRAQLRCVRLPA